MSGTFQQALQLHQQGRIGEAESIYRDILGKDPRHAGALHYLGVAASQRGQYTEAVRLIGDALAIEPDSVSALSNLGAALLKLRRLDEALARFGHALSLQPSQPEILCNHGLTLNELDRCEEAIRSLDRAIAARANFADAHFNRGNALMRLGRRSEAIAAFDAAVAARPAYPEALANRGNALRDAQRIEEALASYERAIGLKPDFAEAHQGEGFCRLLRGDYGRGLAKYEWRWRSRPQSDFMRNFPQPLWLGKQDIAGKTILLHAEQGYGDTINFCRYAAPVAARGATVILEVQPPLKSLLTGIDGAAQVIGLGEALPAFDYHCPLLSLPLALGTTFETIPATVPYLSPPAETLARWRTRLGEKKNPRVGLAWCGNPAQSNNRRRSVPPAELTPLIHCGATVYCLQKDQGPEDRAWLGAHPEVKDLSRALDSFADTAALASLMDVVITIDSAVAHLGGALGLKTWMMLCFAGVDWRWMLGRADNAWYPTARLYRQDASEDWRPVIAALARDLRALTVNNQTTLSPSGLSRGPRAETKKG